MISEDQKAWYVPGGTSIIAVDSTGLLV
jgi:hypothetical protein